MSNLVLPTCVTIAYMYMVVLMAVQAAGKGVTSGSSSGGKGTSSGDAGSTTGSSSSAGSKALGGASGMSYATTNYRVYASPSTLYSGSLGYRAYPVLGIYYFSQRNAGSKNATNYASANYTGIRKADFNLIRNPDLIGTIALYSPMITIMSVMLFHFHILTCP